MYHCTPDDDFLSFLARGCCRRCLFCWWCCSLPARVGWVQLNDSDVPLHQMTASAIGNMPEKDLDAVKEMVIRGVMHADEHLFAFKVSARS